jgi:antitoxin PrlF
MSSATVTSKGQITIPVVVRNALQLKAGDRVDFVEVAPGKFELVAATRRVAELKGLFGKKRVVSVEEMNLTIRKRGETAK